MLDTKQIASKPEDLGIEPERLEAVFARHGKLAGMRTFGTAIQGGSEKPATDETLYHVFSCTKAIVASAVWLLFESGQLRLDERVASIIPQFGTNGKKI